MLTPLALVVLAVALGLSVWAAVASVRDVDPGRRHLQGLFGLEALVLLQAVVGVVMVLGGERPPQTGAFLGYAGLSVLLVPGASIFALEEQSRWGTAAVALGPLALMAVVGRMLQLWSA